MAAIGAPSDCRYLGRKRRHKFSPHPRRNMLVETATISGVSPKSSTAAARRAVNRRNTPSKEAAKIQRLCVGALRCQDAQHRPAFDVLEREVHVMCTRIDRDGVCVRGLDVA